jgi:IgA Peptidase M64
VNPILLLVNERDTAFHVAFGGRPDVSFTGSQDFPGFNPLRLDIDDFNAFLHHLTSKPSDISHIPEGRTWEKGGNDEKLILFLCRSTHTGGVNTKWSDTSRVMFVSLQDDKVHRVMEDPSGNGYETLVSTPDKTKAKQSTWLTVAHEMGHSLRLGDEYGNQPSPIPAKEIPDIERWGNVQMLKDFTGSILNGNDIKWNWPRIAKAVPYLSLSHPDAAHIHTCELASSYAEQSCKPDKIRPGDTVRLRLRNLFFNATLSNELEVVSVEDMKIKIRPKGSGLPPGPPFLPALGSGPPGVMMVIAKDKAGIESTLVHLAIQTHISTTAAPLDAPSSATSWTCSPATAKGLTTPNLPPAPTPPVQWPRLKSWIVGVFEGGGMFNCEAYHATGECVMIDNDRAKQFCHVCRYLLVDQIDPLKHGAIERDFAPQYPK